MRVKIKLKKRAKTVTAPTAAFYLKNPYSLATVSAVEMYSLQGAPALMAQTPQATGASQQGQALSVVRFDIPAGPLGFVLEAFQRASGWQVTVPEEGMTTIESKGLINVLPADQGLRRILDGTGLTFDITAPREATLRVQSVSLSVDVSERRPLASLRYTEPLRDLPQTITIIGREIIEQQGATSLTDVLRNVPGLTLTAGEGGVAAGDNLTLRGNSARNDIFVDGVRDLRPSVNCSS